MIANKKAEINILFSCYFNNIILARLQISVNFFHYTFTLTLFPQILTVHLYSTSYSVHSAARTCPVSCISLFKVTSSLAGHIIIRRKIFFKKKNDLPKSHFEQLLVHFEFQCSSINVKINILIFSRVKIPEGMGSFSKKFYNHEKFKTALFHYRPDQ